MHSNINSPTIKHQSINRVELPAAQQKKGTVCESSKIKCVDFKFDDFQEILNDRFLNQIILFTINKQIKY